MEDDRNLFRVDVVRSNNTINIYSSVNANNQGSFTQPHEESYPSFQQAEENLNSQLRALRRFQKIHGSLSVVDFGAFVVLGTKWVADMLNNNPDSVKDIAVAAGLWLIAAVSLLTYCVDANDGQEVASKIDAVENANRLGKSTYYNEYLI
jgi:hypothetical protein